MQLKKGFKYNVKVVFAMVVATVLLLILFHRMTRVLVVVENTNDHLISCDLQVSELQKNFVLKAASTKKLGFRPHEVGAVSIQCLTSKKRLTSGEVGYVAKYISGEYRFTIDDEEVLFEFG